MSFLRNVALFGKTLSSEKKRLGRDPTREEMQSAFKNAPKPKQPSYGSGFAGLARRVQVAAPVLAKAVDAPKQKQQVSASSNTARRTATIPQPNAPRSSMSSVNYYSNDNLVSDETPNRRRRRRRSA
jgi:hypothetical protein